MGGSVNKAVLVGNVGRDPEIRTTTQGGKWASFSLATSETWRDKASGERKERVQWHQVVVYNEGLVKVVEAHVRKGGKLYVEGQIETRDYKDRDGAERRTTEIVLRPFRGELALLGEGTRRDPDAGARTRDDRAQDGACRPARDMIDDDIPF